MGLYLFLITYAISLFLISVVLVPRSWDGVTSLKDYFLRRRVWFYSLLLLIVVLDTFDSYLKGGIEYILDTGAINIAFSISTIPVALVGIKTENMRFHSVAGVLFVGLQILLGFGYLELLSF